MRGLRWIRGESSTPESHPATQAVLTQAVWCERVVNPQGEQNYDVPLAPGSLTALVTAHPAITAIRQPLPSQGGRVAEDEPALQTRVSERLRHKGRALTRWDYERLVLQEFPTVFAAQCLPGASLRADGVTSDQARSVLVLVSPRIFTPDALTAQSYPPGFTASALDDIRVFLASCAPAAALIEVANPRYVPVTVTATVHAAPRQDPLLVAQRLNADLQRFLSPWIFQPAEATGLGGPGSTAEVTRFLRGLEYLSSVTGVVCSGDLATPATGVFRDVFSVAREIPGVVPVSAWQHPITVLPFGTSS
jgi:hypothetical protein